MKQVGEVEGLQVKWKIVLNKLSRMNSTEEEREGRMENSNDVEVGTRE